MDEPFPGEPGSENRWPALLQAVIERRARIYEYLFPLHISAIYQRYRSTATEQAISQDVQRRRKRLKEILPRELAAEPLLFESLDAILSIEFWVSLRQDQQLTVAQATQVLRYAAGRLAARSLGPKTGDHREKRQMQVKNSLVPNPEQLAGFTEPGPDGPIYMVNLLKFRNKAVYADGRATDLSGAQAYDLYAEGVSRLLARFGGGLVFNAPVERLAIGAVEDLWDAVAIAMYPSRTAMLGMMQSDEMQRLSVHRSAGLAGQLNIECRDAAGSWLDADQ